jgi:hypothetical protein
MGGCGTWGCPAPTAAVRPTPTLTSCCGPVGAEEEPLPPPVDQQTAPAMGVEEAGVRAHHSNEEENPRGAGGRMKTQPRGRWRSSSSTLGASSWRYRGGVAMVAAVRVGEKRRAQRRFKYRWPSKLTCAHTSMPPQELRRHAQWSATNLMAKRGLRSAFCRRVASKRALTHRFPKFGAPMGRSGRVCPFGSPDGACAACLPVSTNRFGQPKIIWVSPL